ncbi:MAG: aspartate/glutamate racemase family protein [Alphaproteobacteria bacterium]|nr:aspartate/glutamate racemase family protein [Alphaproteobacteria bacterium]
MKILGLIGGMSPESTTIYYRLINELVKKRLGSLHSAKLLLWSFDFNEIAELQSAGNWDHATNLMIDAGLRLKKAGADALVICTNTMHKMVDAIEQETDLPLIHIADATAVVIKPRQVKEVGLLATRFTMEQDFYKNCLLKNGIKTITPNDMERTIIHDIIYNELCHGIVNEKSKTQYIEIINELIGQGAEGIILGCTEIGMLIKQEDVSVPVFDTTLLHAQAAVDFALS